jgi:hypothetical protein
MNFICFYYQCSPESIHAIDPALHGEVEAIIRMLPRRETPAECHQDLFWLFTHKGWCHDTVPVGAPDECPIDLNILESLSDIKDNNTRDFCLASTAFDTFWHADFGKKMNDQLLQVKAQFGQVDQLYKDFCGFRIARVESGLSLGIEIVMENPVGFGRLSKHKGSGLAGFNDARRTLTAVGLDCPIWLIGLSD